MEICYKVDENIYYKSYGVYKAFYDRLASMKEPRQISRMFSTEEENYDLSVQDGIRIISSAKHIALSGKKIYDIRTLYECENDVYILFCINGKTINMISIKDGDEEGLISYLDLLQTNIKLLTEEDSNVNFLFWNQIPNGNVEAKLRSLEVPSWKELEKNYSKGTAQYITEIMNYTPKDVHGGKILLMHGAPGTGKTTAIRALAKSWKDWCRIEYILDPEKALGDSSYLSTLLVSDVNEHIKGTQEDKWRLILIEDAEEFLVPQAKGHVGQSVARLLNLGDGLIGQGLKILFLLTTNEHLNKLHPALIRPGRTLANIEFTKLTSAEATEWLGEPSQEATIAELFEAKTHTQIGSGIQSYEPAKGQYL